jgi:hypothetical protein
MSAADMTVLYASWKLVALVLYLKGTHAQDFIAHFSHFLHHSRKDKAEVQNVKNFV